MRHYELVVVLSPMLNQEQASDTWGQIKDFISTRDGEITHEERWGTRRLAYPIRKGSYQFLEGSYHLTRFSIEKPINRELNTFLRLDEKVLRSLVTVGFAPGTEPQPPAPRRAAPPSLGSQEAAAPVAAAEPPVAASEAAAPAEAGPAAEAADTSDADAAAPVTAAEPVAEAGPATQEATPEEAPPVEAEGPVAETEAVAEREEPAPEVGAAAAAEEEPEDADGEERGS